MSVKQLTTENFKKEVIASEKPVLVDFYADWCGPCRMMSPIVEEIAKELGDNAVVGKVNVDENQELAIKYNVMTIPTLIIFKNENIVKTIIGVTGKEEIIALLK